MMFNALSLHLIDRADSLELRQTIATMQRSGQTQLKTKINLGCDIFAHAVVYVQLSATRVVTFTKLTVSSRADTLQA